MLEKKKKAQADIRWMQNREQWLTILQKLLGNPFTIQNGARGLSVYDEAFEET